MSLLKTGQMINCCHPNALMTLSEFLEDYASPETKEVGYKMIEEELKNIPLYFIPFEPFSEQWDHEHCAFCWAKFYLHEGSLQEGYCTRPENSRDADWICPECYEDFKEMFGWSLKRGDTK